MRYDPQSAFATWLRRLLGEDPSALVWPRFFTIPGPGGERAAFYDPHNASLQLYDVVPAELAAATWLPEVDEGDSAEPPCSRVLVFARPGHDQAWKDLEFVHEATVPGYWADGEAAELRARTEYDRTRIPIMWMPADAPFQVPPLPDDWTCRPAEPVDAPAIRDLLATVFHDYPIPEDPAAIAYALLEGEVQGRLVEDPGERVVAYASLESQPGEGAVELTDCATHPYARGRGLMSHLVAALRGDLPPGGAAYALVREDSPLMVRIFYNAGWKMTGRAVGQYRAGGGWVSAHVMVGPSGGVSEP